MTADDDLAGWLATNIETFSTLFDSAGLLAGVIEEAGDDFRYVAANANTAHRYGVSPGGMRGRTGRSLGSPEDAIQRTLAHIDQCHRDGPSQSEIRRAVDGRDQHYITIRAPAAAGSDGARREAFVSLDVSALKSAEVEAARQQSLVDVALDAAAMGIWEYDIVADRLSWDRRGAALIGFTGDPISLNAFMSLVHPDDVERVAAAQDAAERGDGGGYYRIEHRLLLPDGRARWIEITGRLFFDAEGIATRAVGTVRDVDEEVADRERQAILAAELDHRVKNSLSLVLAIVDQARRTSRSPGDLTDRIRNRVLALSKTHNILAARNWREVDIRELLADELVPYGLGETERIQLTGAPAPIGPKGAVSLGMLFHELATNAARHGALASEHGRLSVAWSVASGAAGDEIVLTWKESGGPPVPQQRRKGFGTLMIERGLMREHPGGVRLLFEPDGVRCELKLALNRLMAS
ncbi:MAG TPA: HWE histidine kinase domain-containing protein [Caulobacteraceae bacterium]|nr:HWE histidine kinase domain-containing protein [Caulobacteraceae bacterium]